MTERELTTNLEQLLVAMRAHCGNCIDFLSLLNQKHYTERHGDAGSIGTHMRHVVEFVQCFLDHSFDGTIRYDARRPMPHIEADLEEAKQAVSTLIDRLAIATIIGIHARMTVQDSISKDQPSPEVQSSVERELMFLCSHTLHHVGLLKLIAKSMGIQTAPEFGDMPTTLQYERGQKLL